MFVEESIHEGTQWVVFEPNKEGEKLSETVSSPRPRGGAALPVHEQDFLR